MTPSSRDARVSPGWTLLAVCTAALILPLSFSGGAVATPAIGRDLGGSALALSWITNAFMLTFGSLLLLAGTLADAYGRKRLFLSGVGSFVVVSLALGLAPGVRWLDGLRGVQGMAAAAALSGGSAALAEAFEGPARTRAFSLLGSSFGVGLALGPLLAGALIEGFGWRSVFVSSALVGALALAIAMPRMGESRDPDAGRPDWAGALSFSACLGLLTWSILRAPVDGWSNPQVLAGSFGAGLCLAAFVAVESHVRRPMLDLSLFRYPRFVGVQLLPIATCFCYVVLLVLLPVRFVGVEGRGEVASGLLMLSLSAPMLGVPGLAALLTRWLPAGTLCAAGLLLAAGGLFLLGRVEVGQPGSATLLPMLLIGIGSGLPWGLMDGLSVGLVPKARAGMAAGMFGTTRVAGEGLALALVGAWLSASIQHRLAQAVGADDVSRPLATAAQYLAAGDLGQAARAANLGGATLVQAYAGAFHGLIQGLALMTLVSALLVFGILREPRKRAAADTSTAA